MKPLSASQPAPPRAADGSFQDVPCRPADVVIAVILGVAAIASPLFLGCSFPVARFALEATLAAVIVIWACDRRRSPGALLLPLAIFGLIWLQLMPLPDWLLVWMAPISGGAWKVAQQGIPGAWGRISIDPGATAAGARRLLLGVGSFLVVRDIAANSGIRRGLAAALAVSGTLIWALGLVFPRDTQDDLLLGFIDIAGPIYFWVSSVLAPVETAGAGNLNMITVGRWRYSVADGLVGDGFGPFISSNQFAGAMCLTLPLLMAFWLTFARKKLPAWGAAAGAVAIAATAAWTVGIRAGSRAGGAAIIVGCVAFLALSARERWWRWTLTVFAGITAAMLVTLTAAVFGIISGLESVVPEHLRPSLARLLSDNRSIGIQVGTRMVRASPVAGTGLDSYAEVFSRFEPRLGTMFFAHNDYVQGLAETGLIGGLVAMVVAFFVVRRGVSWFRLQQGSQRILAAGAAAAMIGFASHEFFEWNIHLPAISLLAVMVAGLAAPNGFAHVAGRSVASPVALSARLRLPAAIALVVAVVAAMGVLARDMLTERTAKQLRAVLAADRRVMIDPKVTLPSQSTLDAAIADGAVAAGRDPTNADLPLLLGQLHLHLAARAADEAGRGALEHAAEEWFTKARYRRAICFGLPELVPPPKPAAALNGSRPLGP